MANQMIIFLKQIIKRVFNFFGVDIIRLLKSPKYSLLGLKRLPIKTIIDVGANEGQFARYISKIFPEAKIYCFEPLTEPFKKLKDWAEKQNGRVKVFNLALGEKEGGVGMLMHIEHSTSSSLLKTTEFCERIYPFTKRQRIVKVNISTLDNWAESLKMPLAPEILIKLDVQGYEDRVIKGGKEIFNKAKACILEVCLDKLYEGQANFYEILKLLIDSGFSYVGNLEQSFADDGHIIFIDAVFRK